MESTDDSETATMNDADAYRDAADTEDQKDTAPAGYSLTKEFATDAQKAAFELKLAEMDEHLGKFDLAIEDLRSARSLTKDAAQQKSLDARVAALVATSAREAKNASRRPLIKDELQQSVVVRPRLTAAAPVRTEP
jgi:hypothetical protein